MKGIACPLTRYHQLKKLPYARPKPPGPKNLGTTPGFCKVRHWKVYVSRFIGFCSPPLMIQGFARAIYDLPVRSISLETLSRSACWSWIVARTDWARIPCVRSAGSPHILEKVISPFRLLRNLETIDFKLSNLELGYHCPGQ